jgi:uncharacterized protein with HEPN domain
MKDDRVYLGHIVERIERIEIYTAGGRAAFLADPMIQDAVLRNLEIIGEASGKVSAAFRQNHPEVGWRAAMQLRNVLIHNYSGVNVDRVWPVVVGRLPALKEQIQKILSAGPGDDGAA